MEGRFTRTGTPEFGKVVRQLGVAAIVKKPWKPQELAEMVRAAVRLAELRTHVLTRGSPWWSSALGADARTVIATTRAIAGIGPPPARAATRTPVPTRR